MNPKMLSVHYTSKCDMACPGCYLSPLKGEDELEKEQWRELPYVASTMGIEKIAIAVNYMKTIVNAEYLFVADFIYNCRKNGVKVDITTLSAVAVYLLTLNSGMKTNILDGIDVFSISVDSSKIRDLADLHTACNIPEALRSVGVNSINANLLIKRDCEIHAEWYEDLFNSFDTIHIILEKPFTYSQDEFYSIVEALEKNKVFEDERFILDPCVLFRLGLVDHCHSCSYMIDISPNGNVVGCAYSHSNYPIGNINEISDLPALVEKTKDTIVTHCEFLEFIDENNEARGANTHQ